MITVFRYSKQAKYFVYQPCPWNSMLLVNFVFSAKLFHETERHLKYTSTSIEPRGTPLDNEWGINAIEGHPGASAEPSL